MTQTWFITGAGRGLGAEIAKAALAAGHRVAATGRDTEALELLAPDETQLFCHALDVTSRVEAMRAAQAAALHFGGIDVLVNNAGYGQFGFFEDSSDDDVQEQFEVNLFGILNVCRAVLPIMRRARRGRIFNISSVVGFRGVPGGSLLCASKHAVEGFSESLAREVEPFGISVTLVEPGTFRTGFLSPQSMRFSGGETEDYVEAVRTLQQSYRARNGQQPGDPAKLGAALVRLAEEPNPPLRFLAGPDAVQAMEARIESLKQDMEAWRALSLSTSHA